MTVTVDINNKLTPVRKMYIVDRGQSNGLSEHKKKYIFLIVICLLCIMVSIMYVICGIFLIEATLSTQANIKDKPGPGFDFYSKPMKDHRKHHQHHNHHMESSDNNGPSPFNKYRIICYYVIPSNQTHSRQLPPNFVDPYLCTHIIIGFAGVYNGTLAPSSANVLEVYKTVVGFKEMNPSLKVLLSVEDFTSDGEFGKMVADKDLRLKFSAHVIGFLKQLNFDGIDLDWEFPSWPNPDEQQKKNFTVLLQNIRHEINNHNNETFILSAAVGAPQAILDQSYSIQDIAEYVDFINLMSYDYHFFTKYLPLTGPNSPLFSRATDAGFLEAMNVNWSATEWHRRGMPLEKINVGIPTYGHSFRLVNEDNNGWNAPASGFGKIGSQGFTSYPDACHFISNAQTNKVFDETYLVPYAFNEKDWISYEDEISVEYKAKYIRENKFGGAMIYSLNSDDFYGECGTVKFPLLRRITNELSFD